MKFLVLGSNGMAGHTIGLYLMERGHKVTGLARHRSGLLPTLLGDATDKNLIKSTLEVGSYDIVVNAIGILNKNAEQNKSRAVLVNSWLPHYLADVTEGMSTRVFQMSTDCVFAGNDGPYSEGSLPNGRTFYDRTKALGELNDRKNLTLRNSIVGPDINKNGLGLLNWFMLQEGTVNGYRNAMWTGMTTLELAKAMEACAEEGTTGLVNMVPEGNISKYDLLVLFNKYFRSSRLDVIPFDNEPIDKSLIRTNFSSSFRPEPYEKEIEELALWVHSHRQLYPHYDLD